MDTKLLANLVLIAALAFGASTVATQAEATDKALIKNHALSKARYAVSNQNRESTPAPGWI